MNIDLTQLEMTKILTDKYGEASFRVFYTESDEEWEVRNHKRIRDLAEPPSKEYYVLHF